MLDELRLTPDNSIAYICGNPDMIISAEETTMLEEATGPADHAGRALRYTVRPYGIATFRVRLASP